MYGSLSTLSPFLYRHLLSPIVLSRDTAIKGLQLPFCTFFCVFSLINKYAYVLVMDIDCTYFFVAMEFECSMNLAI